MSVWKFDSNGEIDTDFNSPYGYVSYNTEGTNVEGLDIKIDLDGKLIVSGVIDVDGYCNTTVWRYNPDGTIDNSFGGVGHVSFANNSGGAGGSRGMGVVVDSDNNYLIVGHDNASNGTPDMLIWKVKNDGSLDDTFGDGSCFNGVGTGGAYGCVVFSNATGLGDNSDKGLGIVQQPDGKIVVVGFSMKEGVWESDMVIWRYNENGTLDETFGDGSCNNGVGAGGNYGCSIHNSAAGGDDCDRGWGVVLDGEKLVVVGQSGGPDGYSDMAVWRYNSDGTLDTSFNSVGYVTHHNASGGNTGDRASSIIVLDDGKYLIGGSSTVTISLTNAVLWKYNSDGTMDETFGDGSCNNGVGLSSNLGCIVYDRTNYNRYESYIRHQISVEEIDDGFRVFTAGMIGIGGDSDVLLLDFIETDGPYCCSSSVEDDTEEDDEEEDDGIEEPEESEESENDDGQLSRTGEAIIYVTILSLISLGSLIYRRKEMNK